ncbi:uncharacterized protein PV09_05597 [Verruconis gallopava]|uniref:Uncharacterized protein n=1 Tax=Verruconis gallopava TaxID=253628 RepID=A0A0D2A9V7_9PEZI|nr:uncharacterized protein PV09_05597 [Verruconis gallopava]KIW03390.1 hypothetical protein PV09_05597 [Verruconis gallopava]
MEKKFNRNNLSVSSTASTASDNSSSSTSSISPGLSPRKSLLSPSEFLIAESPPPSPGLPSLIPRHGKKSHTSILWKLRRVIYVFGALSVLTWLALRTVFYSSGASGPLNGDYEIVSADSLPEEPSAVMLSDSRGRQKWTVSIPPHHSFPLLPSQYHEICQQAEHISNELNPSRRKKRHFGYYEKDSYFVDVAEAQKQGLLPDINREGKIGETAIPDDPISGRRPCGKSLTYVMETSDAGMGNTLLGLWMAYGLAKQEGRAFFIDDTRWPYGNYSQYFTLPRHPNCLPPSATQRLPCPHSARHLVVSAATFPFTFGPSFAEQFTDHRKSTETLRRKPMFDLLRAGYEELFHLADEGDAEYVLQKTEGAFKKVRKAGGTNVGLHIRRGDLHPWEYQYEKDYLPITRYMDEVRQILIDKYEHDDHDHDEDDDLPEDGKIYVNGQPLVAGKVPEDEETRVRITPKKKNKRSKLNGTGLVPRHGAPGLMASQVYLASDDADVYSAPEVSRAVRAQDRIVLASKSVLEAAQGGRTNPWIDEVHGWEGGFYRDQFFGLGRPDGDRIKHMSRWKALPGSPPERDAASSLEFPRVDGVLLEDDSPDYLNPPGEAALALRQLVGRAYLMDLAVLSQSDAIVCAVSASACRLLAVMLGWDKAVLEKKWVNVDGGFGWRGLVVPE